MKGVYFVFCFLLFGLSCSSNPDYTNPNLLNVKVNFTLNLALPQYQNLNFPSNPVYIRNYGNGGVIITNTGADYVAFDAHDPNIPYNANRNDCAILTIDGLEGHSTCEKRNTYNLISGTAIESKSESTSLEFAMKQYRVVSEGGGVLRIYN